MQAVHNGQCGLCNHFGEHHAKSKVLVTILTSKKADESVLDRYDRQRRHIAVQHTQAQTIRNKKILAETDPAVRQKNHDELKRSASDPVLARAFMLRASLINSLREAEAIV